MYVFDLFRKMDRITGVLFVVEFLFELVNIYWCAEFFLALNLGFSLWFFLFLLCFVLCEFGSTCVFVYCMTMLCTCGYTCVFVYYQTMLCTCGYTFVFVYC